MLSLFIIHRTFNSTRITLTVDCENRTADITVTHDRIIRDQGSCNIWECDAPEKAEAYLSKGRGPHGSLIETLNAQYRSLAAA